MEAVPDALKREVRIGGRVFYFQTAATEGGGAIGGLLPPVTVQWAGLGDASPDVRAPKGWRRWLYPRRYRHEVMSLATLNDSCRESFRTIAQMIRWGVVE